MDLLCAVQTPAPTDFYKGLNVFNFLLGLVYITAGTVAYKMDYHVVAMYSAALAALYVTGVVSDKK